MGATVPGTVIVCSYLPGEGHFTSDRFHVDPVLCDDDHAYWRGLHRWWDTDLTIINIEHDLEVTDAHLEALLTCPEPLCSWAYRCHWISTHAPDGVLAAGTGAREHYLAGGEEWAPWSAIGLVKIAPAARTGPLDPEVWSQVELSIEAAVRTPWHMHGNASEGWATGLPDVIHHHW